MLFPSFKDGLLNKVVANSQVGNPPDVPEFARGYQGMDMSKIRFIKSLWHEIDQSIVESKYLSEYGHVGQVRLTFEVGPDGHLVENYFRAQASDPILKVVAARAVRKALKNENENLVLPKETTKVVAQFNWAGYATCERRKGTEQNFLSFCKYGENKIKNFTSGERSETYLKAIATHGPWAIEEIQNYRREEDHRKTQFDPFEEMRRDPDYDLGS
ncbi:MAG: hypothetical protein H7061_02485 [Bdellovibrionaceae bacterium]|nr:hypothetical protein [Bdellovibrio sp.]